MRKNFDAAQAKLAGLRQRMREEAWQAFNHADMTAVWVGLYLLSIITDAVPAHRVQCQLRGGTDGHPTRPPKHLMARTWSSFSHDPALAREQQTTTAAGQTGGRGEEGRRREGGAGLLHYLLNYTEE